MKQLRIQVFRGGGGVTSRDEAICNRGRTPILHKKQQNKALFLENKALFLKNKALLRIKVWVNFIFIFQNLLLNHFYCILFSSWVLVFTLTICFII